MSPTQLRDLRVAARIPGRLVCTRAHIDRSRLSDIERGYVKPTDEELRRLAQALDELVRARKEVSAVADVVGWPMG